MKKELVIFDFDGTIADSLAVAVEIFNVVGKDFDLPVLAIEQVAVMKQKRIPELLEMAGLSWVQLPVFLKRARSEFKKHRDKVLPIEGMVEVIRQLHKDGYKMGILTSNSRENVLHFLEKHEIEHFDFVVAPSSLFGKAGALKKILKEYKLPVEAAVMIGDELRDVKAAHACGMDMMAVSWGFNSLEVLEKAQPLWVVRDVEEILEELGKKGKSE